MGLCSLVDKTSSYHIGAINLVVQSDQEGNIIIQNRV